MDSLFVGRPVSACSSQCLSPCARGIRGRVAMRVILFVTVRAKRTPFEAVSLRWVSYLAAMAYRLGVLTVGGEFITRQ